MQNLLFLFLLLLLGCIPDYLTPENNAEFNVHTESTADSLLQHPQSSVSFINDIQPLFFYACYDCHAWSLTHSSIVSFINNGKLENELFISKDMPPPYSIGPKYLSQEELILIQNWIDDGFPNN